MSATDYTSLNTENTHVSDYQSFNRLRLFLLTITLAFWESVAFAGAVTVPVLYYQHYEPVASWPYPTIWLPAAAFVVVHTTFGLVLLGSWWCRQRQGLTGV